MKLMRSMSLTISILASSFASSAESYSSTGKLAGVILDRGGARVPAAKIVVQAKRFRREVVSGDDGSYKIALRRGDYIVSVIRDGFSPMRKENVRIKSNATTKLDITLLEIIIEEFPVQRQELPTEPLIINNKIPVRKPKPDH